jgi:NAD+ diphosphatase
MADHRLSTTFAYGGPGIDRVSMWRADDTRIQSLMKDKNARVVPVWKESHLIVRASDAGPRPRYLSFEEAGAHITPTSAPPVFLGIHDNKPWFALGITGEAPPEFGEGQFEGLRENVGQLPITDASLLAYARAMVIWHENHKYCGRCGTVTDATESGHSRTCTNATCSHRSFPRTDPVVITLIIHPDGERALLGRQPRFPKGFYSCVAGFVEPGETLEAAVARETKEETGVDVGDVVYKASQPWPFPASIMLGFHAQAITTDIHMDDEELEDCRWFTRPELLAAGEGFDNTEQPFRLPPAMAIARFLIDAWLNEKP